MYNKLTGQFEIYELDSSTQAWGAIGEAVDERENTRSDTLWDQRRSNMACAVCDARAGATNLLSEDESGIVRYDDKIGVIWSNQTMMPCTSPATEPVTRRPVATEHRPQGTGAGG